MELLSFWGFPECKDSELDLADILYCRECKSGIAVAEFASLAMSSNNHNNLPRIELAGSTWDMRTTVV